jgi:hypothetical protein
MGAKLLQFFKEAEKFGKLQAKMRFAMLTKTSSSQVGEMPDTPESIQKFAQALEVLKKEYK